MAKVSCTLWVPIQTTIVFLKIFKCFHDKACGSHKIYIVLLQNDSYGDHLMTCKRNGSFFLWSQIFNCRLSRKNSVGNERGERNEWLDLYLH